MAPIWIRIRAFKIAQEYGEFLSVGIFLAFAFLNCVDRHLECRSESSKLLNKDPVWIKIHNAGFVDRFSVLMPIIIIYFSYLVRLPELH